VFSYVHVIVTLKKTTGLALRISPKMCQTPAGAVWCCLMQAETGSVRPKNTRYIMSKTRNPEGRMLSEKQNQYGRNIGCDNNVSGQKREFFFSENAWLYQELRK